MKDFSIFDKNKKYQINSFFKTARDTSSDYIAWGHSTVVDPWGKIVTSAQEGEETVIADLGMKFIQINKINSIDNFSLNSLLYFHFFYRHELGAKSQRTDSSFEATSIGLV